MAQKHLEGDTQLLAAARAGDRVALERLVERHLPAVYRFGLRLCGNAEDAADVQQETFLALVRSIAAFRGDAALSTYLYTVARSFCQKHRRKSKYAPDAVESLDLVSLADLPASHEGLDEGLARTERAEALEAAIGGLAPLYREVLVLRDVEGLPAADVAEILGVTVQTVKSRLHRARMTLRDRLAPALGLQAEPVPERPATGRGAKADLPADRRVKGDRPADCPAAPGPAAGCPDVPRMFSRYLEGELDAATCARMETHLAGCPDCRGACKTLRKLLAACRAAPEPEVPADVRKALQAAIRGFLAGVKEPGRGV